MPLSQIPWSLYYIKARGWSSSLCPLSSCPHPHQSLPWSYHSDDKQSLLPRKCVKGKGRETWSFPLGSRRDLTSYYKTCLRQDRFLNKEISKTRGEQSPDPKLILHIPQGSTASNVRPAKNYGPNLFLSALQLSTWCWDRKSKLETLHFHCSHSLTLECGHNPLKPDFHRSLRLKQPAWPLLWCWWMEMILYIFQTVICFCSGTDCEVYPPSPEI